MVLLTAENIRKSYGTRVIFDDISFSIHEGDKIGVIGVNGTGKSTLSKVIMGDSNYKIVSGSISYDGKCINELSEKDRKLIELRYFMSKTQTEVAGKLGMSQVQVSRREKKILKELNKQIFVERLKYKYNQWREKRLYGKEAPDAISINTE